MSNISVTTNQQVIDVTNVNGVTVTTPEGQTISVSVPNSSVNVTNTTEDITVLTAGTLNIQAGGITSVNGNTGPIVVLDTDDISEGTTNKYFSQALARQSLSAGTGISYDNSTGVITNTSINTDTTYTIASASTTGGANLNLVGSDSSTDSVAYKGAGATTVTSTDANTVTISSTDTNTTYTQNISSTTGGANLNLVGSDSSTDTVKFANGTGVTVAYTDADTATVSIGQPVATTDDVTFDDVTANGKFIGEALRLTTDGTRAFPASVPLIINQDGTSTINNIQSWKSKGTYASPTTITPGDAVIGLTNIVYTGLWDGVTPSVGTESGWNFGGDLYWLNYTDSATDTISPLAEYGYSTTRGSWNLSTFQTPDSDSTSTIQDNTTWKFDGQRLKAVTSDIGSFFSQVDSTPKITAVTAGGTEVDFKFKTDGSFTAPGTVFGDGGDFGNVTVGVATDNTITTTTGDLILDSNSGDVFVEAQLNGPTGSYFNIVSDDHFNISSPNFVHFNKTTTSSAGVSINPGGDSDNDDSLIYIQTNTTDGTKFSRTTWNTFRTTDGINFTPTQSNDLLGQFGFNGNYATGTTPTSSNLSCQIFASATENWTSTQQGARMNFFINKQGTTTSYPVISANPSGSEFWADTFNFYTASATPVNTLSIDSSGNVVTAGNLDVQGGTITDSTGALTISTGASDGAITLDPNGTGNVALTFNNGGNLTNDRNYVFGSVRNATQLAAGDIGFGSLRGISIDNSVATTKRPGIMIRSYGGGLTSGNPRSTIGTEAARGSSATPTNLTSGDVFGEWIGNGYTSTGWTNEIVVASPAIARFATTEAWDSGTSKVGSKFQVLLMPASTTYSTGNLKQVLDLSPETFNTTSDLYTLKNKAGTTNLTLSSTGDLVVTGDLTITGNDIKSSGGNATITMTSANTVTTVKGDNIILEKADGTDLVSVGQTTTTSNIDKWFFRNSVTTNNATSVTVRPGLATAAGFTDRNSRIDLTNLSVSATDAPNMSFNSNGWDTGTNLYVPTMSGDSLGELYFAGQYSSTGTLTSAGSSVRFKAEAAEDFTGASNYGGRFVIATRDIGTTTLGDRLAIDSAQSIYKSDSYVFQDSAGVDIAGGKIDYRRTFGCWHKVADVTAAAADTVYNFDWTNNVTPHVNTQGITISNTSRINFDTAGDYNVVIEMVGKNVDNADRVAYIWLAKNGTDLAETAIKLVLTKDTTTMLAKDWLVDGLATNDYLEVRFAVDTTVSGISLEYTASQSSPYVRPAVASATLTITPVGA